jgi:hypothetical protein
MVSVLRAQRVAVLLVLWGTACAGVPEAGPSHTPQGGAPHVPWRRNYPFARALLSEVRGAPDGSLWLLAQGQPPAEPESPYQLSRLSQDGTVRWRRPVASDVSSLELDPQGRPVLSGVGPAGVHVVALRADGSPRWEHRFALPGLSLEAPDVSVGQDGSVVLAGRAQVPPVGVSKAYVRKLHPSGALAWSTLVEVGRDGAPDAMSVDGAGNVWLLGGGVPTAPARTPAASSFLAMLSPRGEPRWLRWLPPDSLVEALAGSLQEGAFVSVAGPARAQLLVPGARILHVSPEGKVRWTRRIASRDGLDELKLLTALPDGGVRAHVASSYGEGVTECPEDAGAEGRQPDSDSCRAMGEGPSLFVLDLDAAGRPGRVSHFGHQWFGEIYRRVLPSAHGCLVVHDFPMWRCGIGAAFAKELGIALPEPVPVRLGPRLRLECPTWTSTAAATGELSAREEASPSLSDGAPLP